MLYERPLTRLTRAKLGLDFRSQPEQAPPSNPSHLSSSSSTSSASPSSPSTQDTQPHAATDLPNSQQPQPQQLKQQKQQRKQLKQKQKQQVKVKNEDNCQPVLPTPRSTKIISPPVIGPASDDTADTADNNNINNYIPPNTPDYTSCSSSEQPSRPISQERTRGGTSNTLEVDTHSQNYSPSPYRTPTWSPESTSSSSQQADVALTQELLRPKQEESNFDTGFTAAADNAENPLLSSLSLLSAVASVVGNRIGSPGLGNLVSVF